MDSRDDIARPFDTAEQPAIGGINPSGSTVFEAMVVAMN